jgi:hypothetical protein
VVTDREYVKQAYWFDTAVGADLSEVPEHLRPALELAKRLMANSEGSEKSDDEAPDDADE